MTTWRPRRPKPMETAIYINIGLLNLSRKTNRDTTSSSGSWWDVWFPRLFFVQIEAWASFFFSSSRKIYPHFTLGNLTCRSADGDICPIHFPPLFPSVLIGRLIQRSVIAEPQSPLWIFFLGSYPESESVDSCGFFCVCDGGSSEHWRPTLSDKTFFFFFPPFIHSASFPYMFDVWWVCLA